MTTLKDLISQPIQLSTGVLLLLFDLLLSILIIYKVSYTEIDWKAYMEEVEGYLAGERDYTLIHGNTGPLVYPAGFLYIFAFFRFITEEGRNIFKAQCLFAVIYLFNLILVFLLYHRNGKIPAWICALLLLSKRIHSIYMLRMFNDCVAVLFGYLAIYLFTREQWRVGSVVYSLAVSVKMNMFLLAPGIFIVWLLQLGVQKTIECIVICAIVQIVVGYPFLSTYPISYLSKAFEFSRVFLYKWTVNFKFLPEEIFLHKSLSIGLLVFTALGYLLYLRIRLGKALFDGKKSSENWKKIWNQGVARLSNRFIISTIFGSNIIGVVFARTLHYQFYCWYFHMIPLILWQSKIPLFLSVCVIFGIELAFNVYPATAWSSLLLQSSHVMLLAAIFTADLPYSENDDSYDKSNPLVSSSREESNQKQKKRL